MRTEGWERRLKEVVEKHMRLPAGFGTSDCYIIADDAVEAVTGVRMYADALGYKTEAGAAKKLRARGFATVEDAFRAKFTEIPVSLAQRGDIGVMERDGALSGGVFTSIGFMTRGEDACLFLGASEVRSAFRVE